MHRLILLALAIAALAIPTTADARHGRHGLAGTVAAYDATTGDLTLELRGGREVSALVDDDTRQRCDDDTLATASRHGDDDGAGHDAGDDHGDHSSADDDDDEHDCGDIAVGDTVTRARIDVEDGEAYWTKLRFAD